MDFVGVRVGKLNDLIKSSQYFNYNPDIYIKDNQALVNRYKVTISI